MIAAGGIAIGLLIVFFLGRTALQSSQLERAMQRARQQGEVEPVAEAIAEMPADKQPAQFDQAIGKLWQGYARREAAELVVASMRRSDATILQYWAKQVLEVEPAIASEVFTEEFLAEHFRPEVAERCGSSCGCG